jgi:hypothetical protein
MIRRDTPIAVLENAPSEIDAMHAITVRVLGRGSKMGYTLSLGVVDKK